MLGLRLFTWLLASTMDQQNKTALLASKRGMLREYQQIMTNLFLGLSLGYYNLYKNIVKGLNLMIFVYLSFAKDCRH